MKRLFIFIIPTLLCISASAQTPISTAGSVIVNACRDAGSTDDYACSLSIGPPAYTDGQVLWFKPNTSNTGTATVNFNSLGPKTIVKVVNGIATMLVDNDIRAGQWVQLMYDGTNMQMQSMLGNYPSKSDVGLGNVVNSDTTNASNISSGTLPAARLPNPTSSTLGGTQSLASTASKWINTISTSGVPSATQPAFTDVSGTATAAQIPAALSSTTSVNGTSIGASKTLITTDAAQVLNHPTIGISGTSASSHVLTVGSAPTCAFTSGGGTSPSCALETGSTDHAGTMTITTGSGSPGSAGTITLTFNATMGTNSPACVTSLTKGATDWSVSSTIRVTTQSTSAPVFTWNSQSATALVALTASTNYKITYVCFAK